eukprot:tig00000923_g5468.t1
MAFVAGIPAAPFRAVSVTRTSGAVCSAAAPKIQSVVERRVASFAYDATTRFAAAARRPTPAPVRQFVSTTIKAVSVNEKAPEFSLPDQNGNTVSLADFKGKKNIVLFFYPKDDTPGCTAEACAFRDSYEQFASADTVVLGISSDSASSHKTFASKYNLNFPLLADTTGSVRKAFNVPGAMFGMLPGRVTYVIDKEGTVRLVFDSAFKFQDHVAESLKILKQF